MTDPSLHKKVYGPAFYVNCNFDTLHAFNSSNNDGYYSGRHPDREIKDVKPGEILLCKKQQAGSRTGKARVFSFLNGITAGADRDLARADIKDHYVYFGVAETEHRSTGKYDVQGLVARVGGVVTVHNESKDTIHPGSRIVVDVPEDSYHVPGGRKGIHPDKRRCIFREAKDGETDADHIAVVGSAKSFAKPGSTFELLLHHRTYM